MAAALRWRWIRPLSYALVAVSGLTAIFWPPVSVKSNTSETVVITWAILLAVSAMFCAVGSASDRWVGEYVGLIPLGLSALVFAFSALSRGLAGIAGGAFLLGFFLWLAVRWQEVATLRIQSTQYAQHPGPDGDGGA